MSRALVHAGAMQQGLTAARYALELAGPDALPDALDLAIAASRVLGRDAQVADLSAKRARLAPAPADPSNAGDPTDADAARAELARSPSAAALAQLWVASRWNPRDAAARVALARALPPGDPRLAVVQAELVALAGDSDPARALIAVQALPRPRGSPGLIRYRVASHAMASLRTRPLRPVADSAAPRPLARMLARIESTR